MRTHRATRTTLLAGFFEGSRTGRRAHGHTLFELVISLTICSVLLLAMQSIVVIASRAIPNGQTVPSLNVNGADVMQTISRDLMYATAISEMTSTAITFTVPDRNNDGAAETIRYAWSGTAGAPLTRRYNGGTVVNVLPSVQAFSLAYDKRAVQQPTTYTTSAETLLDSNTGISLLGGDSSVTSTNWPAQFFTPTLPGNATSWAVTRVTISAKAGSSGGQSLVQIRPVDSSNLPTSTVLDQQTMLSSNLTGSSAYQTFTFTNATGLSPSRGAAIVVMWSAGSTASAIHYLTSISLSNEAMATTTNSGSSWSNPLLSDLNFTAYGTYNTPNAPTYTYNLTNVRVSVQQNSDATTTLSTDARVLNEPPVTGP
jgi:type II secretory pathway component PulJ